MGYDNSMSLRIKSDNTPVSPEERKRENAGSVDVSKFDKAGVKISVIQNKN